MKYRMFDVMLGVAALCLTVCFFVPANIYLLNRGEFYGAPGEILQRLLLTSAGIFVLLAAALTAMGTALRRYIVPGLAFVTAAVWVQGYILIWDYGPFDGSSLEFQLSDPRAADLMVWLLLAALVFGAAVFKRVSFRLLFLTLLFVQGGNMLFVMQSETAFERDAETEESVVAVSKLNQFTFSKDDNIIILVLDAFQTDVFNEYIETYPEFKTKLPGFTYYPDALANTYFSSRAIPAILTGQLYEADTPFSTYLNNAYANYSIPAQLGRAGYYVGVYNYFTLAQSCFHPNIFQGIADNYSEEEEHFEAYYGHELRRIMATALFRIAPHLLKNTIYRQWLLEAPLEQDRDVFLHGIERYGRTGDSQPRFNYYHLQGLHQPHVIDGEILDWTSPESSRRMAALLCGLIERFISKLQGLNIYDDAAILIIADHGLLWESDQIQYGAFDSPRVHRTPPLGLFAKKPRALPLVLFKPPRAKGDLIISDSPVSLKDITPTVLDVAGILDEDHYEGKSLLRLGDEQRIRRFFSSEYRRRSSGPTYEYAISGFSWYDQSWNYTGNVYSRSGIDRQPLDNYLPGLMLSFGRAGNGIQYLDGNWRPVNGAHAVLGTEAAIALPLAEETDGTLVLNLVLAPYPEDGRPAPKITRLYMNDVNTGSYTVSERIEIEAAVPPGILTFSDPPRTETPPRQPWLVSTPQPSDTRIEIRLEISGESAPGNDNDLSTVQLLALTLAAH